jgi:hypothetical protein
VFLVFAEAVCQLGIQGVLTAAEVEMECWKFLKTSAGQAGPLEGWVAPLGDTEMPDSLQSRIELTDEWKEYRFLLRGVADVQSENGVDFLAGLPADDEELALASENGNEDAGDQETARDTVSERGAGSARSGEGQAVAMSEELGAAVCEYPYPRSLDAAPARDRDTDEFENLCRRLEAEGFGSVIHEELPRMEEQRLGCLEELVNCLESENDPRKCVESYILGELDLFASFFISDVTNVVRDHRFHKLLGRWCNEYLPQLENRFKPKLDKATIGIIERAFGSVEGKIIGSVDRLTLVKRVHYWQRQAIKKLRSTVAAANSADNGTGTQGNQDGSAAVPEASVSMVIHQIADGTPEGRLAHFMHDHPGTTYADIKFSAIVHTPEFQDWRNCRLKPDSVMSKRIEDVLSGATLLKKKPPKRRVRIT